MPIGSVSFKYTLKDFKIKKKFDARVNIKNDFEYLRLSSGFDSNSLGISYVSSAAFSSSQSLLLAEEEGSVVRNLKQNIEEVEEYKDNFFIDYAGFQIADVVKEIDGETVPLYLWHDLSKAETPVNIELLDANRNPINKSLWLYLDETETLGYDRRGIYTNLKCSISKIENRYEIFYVRYKDASSNTIKEELLDSEGYYSQSSYVSTRNLREYVMTQQDSQYNISIVFDSLTYSPTPLTTSQRYWIKRKDTSKIYLEIPENNSSSERWNIKISPGNFYLNDKKYWIPEYYSQLFTPTFPYRFLKEKKALRISSNLIFTDMYPISNLEIPGYYLYVILKEKSGAVRKAFTNDPAADTYITKQGFVTNIFYEKDVIKSVSSSSGFILLNQEIAESDEVFLSYRYAERYFHYDELSLNPSINQSVLGKKVLFYIIPDSSERSVHHLVANKEDIILESSETPRFATTEGCASAGTFNSLVDNSFGDTDHYSGFEIEILSGKNSGIKNKISSYNRITKTITFSKNFNFEIEEGTFYRILKTIKGYTRDGESYQGWEGIVSSLFYLKIGEVFVTQSVSVPDINVMDVRVLGGGINENKLSAALKLQNEVSWYWDAGNWDGVSYPGLGAIVLNVPRHILKEIGGTFEREQVEEIVKRHVASGSYVIIKYYDESTEIKNIVPGNASAFVEWKMIDANYYNIYLGNSPDNLTLYKKEPGTRSSILLKNLDNNKEYYVQVEAVVGGYPRLGSRIIGFMPFSYSTTLPPLKYGDAKFLKGSYE